MKKHIGTATAVLALTVGAGQVAQAESKGYIVSLWVPAMNNFDESGCPNGKNIVLNDLAAQALKVQGMPQAQIEKVTSPETMTQGIFSNAVPLRAVKDGKPVNAYVHPMAVPNATIRYDEAKEGFGFNLDGKVEELDYIDPLTKEAGVDNNAARVFGCMDRARGSYEAPPSNQSYRWQNHYNAGNSWLLEVTNNSDRPINWQNEENVTVIFYRGEQVPLWNSSGHQRNVTYTIDPHSDLKKANSFKGKIVDGKFISERTDQFLMTASSRVQPVYDFKSALMRMTFKPNGDMEAFVGGYMPINMIYFPFGDYGSGHEWFGSMDVPGVYQGLAKLADTDIDAVNGKRTRISYTYLLRAVPAYLIHPNTKVASRR